MDNITVYDTNSSWAGWPWLQFLKTETSLGISLRIRTHWLNSYHWEVLKDKKPWLAVGKTKFSFSYPKDVWLEGNRIGTWHQEKRYRFFANVHLDIGSERYTAKLVSKHSDFLGMEKTFQYEIVSRINSQPIAAIHAEYNSPHIKITSTFEQTELLWVYVFFAGYISTLMHRCQLTGNPPD